MPTVSNWEPPPVAFVIEGYPIYITYKNDECSGEEGIQASCWYAVLVDGGEPFDGDDYIEFDVRELPEYKEAEESRTKELGGDPAQQCLIPYEPPYRGFHKRVIYKALINGAFAEALGAAIKFPLEKKKWSVGVVRTAHRTKNIEVQARSYAEAEALALEEAPNRLFDQSEIDADYESGGAICVETD